MEKLNRNSRVVIITKILIENPNKIIGLNYFSEMLNAAKSTISEDIVIIREILDKLSMGKVETIAGAAGGIKFIPKIGKGESQKFLENLCKLASDYRRLVPGNFLYVTDIMFDPSIISKAAIILSSFFDGKDIDYVITVETKGVPLAYEVAKCLGVPLVTARRDSKVTEGSTVSINYVSGTSGKIQQMCLSRKSLKTGSKCIFIDDFMRGGGTAKGIVDLLKEFDSELMGIGVLIDNKLSTNKVTRNYVSLIDVVEIDENLGVKIVPSDLFK
ncbi:pur operon repressor [Clostridium tarantellae]|uniref:Pur operon repressor n=1 Tax=Clostridium tarantellae TaxID=39493 RepID=A0A6I1MPF9_9CLOT|nr:pur operon repressor [Clostridium tarantellae]MPQ42179.1 pur operon repressor [Clostridium tarantellae]